jgi:DnaJ-class molecular chaperone
MSHAEKCPVCNGKGLVAAGFYIPRSDSTPRLIQTDTEPETCRSCKGKGYVSADDDLPLSMTIQHGPIEDVDFTAKAPEFTREE